MMMSREAGNVWPVDCELTTMTSAMRVSLDKAHLFLGTFGITRPTKAYERWFKPGGFELEDFIAVLSDSPFVFTIDWRAALPEELGPIAAALDRLGTRLDVDVPPNADAGWVRCGSQEECVKYVPRDNDDFTNVIRAIQRIIPAFIEFRASPDNGACEQWVFAVLLRDEWTALERVNGELVAAIFKPFA
jgi:hypothetical protein